MKRLAAAFLSLGLLDRVKAGGKGRTDRLPYREGSFDRVVSSPAL